MSTGFSLICIILVVSSYTIASGMCLPKTGVKKGGSKGIPGWNEQVQAQQDTSLFWRDIWMPIDSPRNGEVDDIMR